MRSTSKRGPFAYPTNNETSNFDTIPKKQLWQEIKSAEKATFGISSLKRTFQLKDQKEPKLPKEIHDEGKIRKRGAQICSARDYLWAVEEAAKNRHISKLLSQETERLEDIARKEDDEFTQYQRQIELHNAAFESFLYEHYEEVSATLQKNDEAAQHLQDQEERFEYFSGLLKAAQTVQEEEKERLQELTAFQHFLASVTPEQSLKDLLRCIYQKRKEKSDRLKGVELGKTTEESEAAASQEQGSTVGTLQSEVRSIRMINCFPPKSNSKVSASVKQAGEDSSASEECEFNSHLFDPYLEDPSYLLKLSRMYENQCHALLSLSTRLKQHTEALNTQLKIREEKLQTRLRELDRLQESQREIQVATEIEKLSEKTEKNVRSEKTSSASAHLQDTEALIRDWGIMAGDMEAKEQLAILGRQIGNVVSDVFGSSEFIPLIHPRLDRSQDDDANIESAGLGHGALLTLLEARVTDLCSQLDFIPKNIRDPIFKRCEHERKALAEEARRQEEEVQRANRREKHLRRALESPPPRRL